MKKFLFTIVLMLGILASSAQIRFGGCIIEQTKSDPAVPLKLDITPERFFWTLHLTNTSDQSIIIDWDGSVMIVDGNSGNIVFPPASSLTNNAPKGTAVIAPLTKFSKPVFPSVSFSDKGFLPIFTKSEVKKNGSKQIKFIFSTIQGDKKQPFEVEYLITPEK